MKTSRLGRRPWGCLTVLAGALALVSTGVRAETSCIESGSTESVAASSKASAGMTLETGALSGVASGTSLEARFRTLLESLGIALKSTAARGFYLFVK